MIRKLPSLAVALLVAAGACGRGANHDADTALNNDLSLAAQAKAYRPLDSMSAAERGLNGTPAAARPTTRRTTASGEVARTRRSSTTSSTASSAQSGEVTVKHTNRDAAIGAAAGAVIGATTSRNKVKGGVIGAAIGGILGGVIGNNVDKTKKKP
ncbi:MAG TPA: YMGG-like glycine zipper-containing protein [Gemmatimonadaceae bacterium]|jgi:phosphotransferase system  glucose/maltose/N-acetylglucosamine-specific IIC component|nr:YMGG-like glycine zipper-containing protein [Gemmatimonadaceae bacterium]